MCSFGRRVWIEWMLIMVVLLWYGKNGMCVEVHIQVTNALDANVDLHVFCHHIESNERIVHHNTSTQFDYSGDTPISKPPFLCLFRFGEEFQVYMYNMFTLFDFQCKQHCEWFIRESGPCNTFYSNKLVCMKWHLNPTTTTTQDTHPRRLHSSPQQDSHSISFT